MKNLKILVSLVLLLFSVPAFADFDILVEVNLPPTANPAAVVALALAAVGRSGTVTEVLPDPDGYGSLMRLSVPALPNLTPGNGIGQTHVNVSAALPSILHARCWVRAPQTADAFWYRTQPSFKLINLHRALNYATGGGAVVAILDSLVDYSHPALA